MNYKLVSIVKILFKYFPKFKYFIIKILTYN